MRLIAVGARHTRAAAALILPAGPRLVRVALAHPAGVLTAAAFDHWAKYGSGRAGRHNRLQQAAISQPGFVGFNPGERLLAALLPF
jgi:hypothetical protein